MNFDLFGSIYQSMKIKLADIFCLSVLPHPLFFPGTLLQKKKKKKSVTVSAVRTISAISLRISAYDYIVLHIPLHNRDMMLNIGEDYRDNGGRICGPEY